jgi:predicted DNA-binding ribbon-helix-helix protein
MRKGKIHLEEPPKRMIKTHENEDPVRIKIERKFYTQLERTAEKLGITPEVLLSNILLKKLKELEGKIEKEKK